MDHKHPVLPLILALLIGVWTFSYRVSLVSSASYTDVDVDTAYQMITGDEYPNLIAVDVRTKSEYDNGHIYGSIWIPHDELESRLAEIEDHRHREVLIYAQCGCPRGESVEACDILVAHGYTKVYRMAGTSPDWGFDGWVAKGYPVWIATVHNINSTYNYDTIQAAIDGLHTLNGHTIHVDAGTYYERVTVSKAVSLIGQDPTTTIIDGESINSPLEVTTSHVEIQGFTLQHSGTSSAWSSGILLNATGYTTITKNVVQHNQYGIRIEQGISNIIYHNNFINNTHPIYVTAGPNSWNDTYPSGGNYWSDYKGVDSYSGVNQDQNGSDGLGDQPYLINHVNQDSYPLMFPYDIDGTPPFTINDYQDYWHTEPFTITLTATDYQSGVLDTYYQINEGTTYSVNMDGHPRITTDGESNTLTYWSRDHADNIEGPTLLTMIKLDTQPPLGSIVINDDAAKTNTLEVTLMLSASDDISGLAEMRFSNDGVAYTLWEPYADTRVWTLSEGDGPKTVYVQYKDQAGLIVTFFDTIVVDTTPLTWPILIAEGVPYTNTTSVTLTLMTPDEVPNATTVRFSNDGVAYTLWEPYADTRVWTLSEGDGPKTVYVQYQDNVGLNATYSDTILLDTTPPAGTLTINDDATYTNTTTITLTLTAKDEIAGVSCVRISQDGLWDTELWEPFTTIKPRVLPLGDGLKHVYYQIKDTVGWISETYSDTILLDTTPPAGTLTINDDVVYTNTRTVTLQLSATDAIAGLAEMRFSNDGVAYTLWEPYADTRVWTLSEGDGPKTVYVQYRDRVGLVNTCSDALVLDTVPPVAVAGTNQTVTAGSLVTLSGGDSSDDEKILNYRWDFANGTILSLTDEVAYTFSEPGQYLLTLTVTDAAGNYASDDIVITVFSQELVLIEFLYYEPCPTCPVTQRQYEIFTHNSLVLDTLQTEMESQVVVNRIHFYSDEGLKKLETYGLGLEDWNAIVVNQEKLIIGEVNASYLRAIVDAYLAESVHDIAITKISPSSTTLFTGDVLNITVMLRNSGIETENFEVHLYCNTSVIGVQYGTLLPDHEVALPFEWDTTDTMLGSYVLRAYVTPVKDEVITINNEHTCTQRIEVATSSMYALPSMLVLAFSFGFFETFSPCLIILLSFVLSYTLGQSPHFKDNFLRIQSFGLGFIAATLLLAITFGMFFLSMPSLQHALTLVVSIFALLFGLNLLGLLKLPSKFSFQTKPLIKQFTGIFFMLNNIFIGLFLLGFVFYFLDPCIAPIFIAMIPLLLQEHFGLIILVFCIGAFIPFLGVGVFVGSMSRLVQFSQTHRSKIRAISGIILIVYAIYLLLFNLLPTL